MRDPMGDRMKQQYEDRTRFMLPRRTYTIMRLDGRAFHTVTKYMERPFDWRFAAEMDFLASNLCAQVSGTVFAYVQSDEISLLLQDFESIGTQPWFDGNVQKMVSVAASYAGAIFGAHAVDLGDAHFDARVFTIPDPVEVANYFLWRQRDARRNAVQMAAQSRWSPKQLEGRSIEDLIAMMAEGHLGLEPIVFDEHYDPGFIMGRWVIKETYVVDSPSDYVPGQSERTRWAVYPAPQFSTDPGGWLARTIPVLPSLLPDVDVA